MSELPVAYAVALRLEAAGEPANVIAAALDAPADGVADILTLAHAKLERLLARAPEPLPDG